MSIVIAADGYVLIGRFPPDVKCRADIFDVRQTRATNVGLWRICQVDAAQLSWSR